MRPLTGARRQIKCVARGFVKSDEFAAGNRSGKVRWRTKFRDCRLRSEMPESVKYRSADQLPNGIFMIFWKARQTWHSGQWDIARIEYRM
jgi:hypothetical protein